MHDVQESICTTKRSSSKPDIVIVTGMSGAGKSTVLRTLEDLNFFCVDNLPGSLLPSFFSFVKTHCTDRQVALGIDVRDSSITQTIEYVKKVRERGDFIIQIIFLAASAQTLVRRFQETRRKHPLGDTIDLSDALEREKVLLLSLIDLSDAVIDTDQLTIHQLRSLIRTTFAPGSSVRMVVTLTSFGFKYGVPQENNFVFDVRSLPNPYFIPQLRLLDGTHPAIETYLFEQRAVQEYWQRFLEFFIFSLEKALQEGRFFVQVAIGCTGGRHRSVALVEKLARMPQDTMQFFAKHRDIKKQEQE